MNFLDKKFAGSEVALPNERVLSYVAVRSEAPTFGISRGSAQLVLPSNEAAKDLFDKLGIVALGPDENFRRCVALWNYGTGDYALNYHSGMFVFRKQSKMDAALMAVAVPLNQKDAALIENHFEQPNVDGPYVVDRLKQAVITRMNGAFPGVSIPQPDRQLEWRLKEEPELDLMPEKSARRFMTVGFAMSVVAVALSAYAWSKHPITDEDFMRSRPMGLLMPFPEITSDKPLSEVSNNSVSRPSLKLEKNSQVAQVGKVDDGQTQLPHQPRRPSKVGR